MIASFNTASIVFETSVKDPMYWKQECSMYSRKLEAASLFSDVAQQQCMSVIRIQSCNASSTDARKIFAPNLCRTIRAVEKIVTTAVLS